MNPFTIQYRIIAMACLLYTVLFNLPFFARFLEVNPENFPLLLSGIVLVWAIHFLFFSILAAGKLTKLLLAVGFIGGAVSSYFSLSYGVIVDADMLKNALETDTEEALGLLNLPLLTAVILGGLLPSYYLSRIEIPRASLKKEVVSKLAAIAASLVLLFSMIYPFSADYANFIREHKQVRYFATPITPLYSLLMVSLNAVKAPFERPGEIARVITDDVPLDGAEEGHELIILIIGETVRADHLSLNGYERQTNPELRSMDHVVSFTHFGSCGTATAVSVPCMFSPDGRATFSDDSIFTKENILDVLSRQKVAVLWRDNNSSSRGVADRVAYESYKKSGDNPVCDPECRDEGMLSGLDHYISRHPGQDILIVLHAMGSHGPEYFKRYPEAFNYFQPTCETNQLSECTHQELENSYDNSILYADHFIAGAIGFLKGYSDYETALLYVSDHGESLGENHVYLHGLPYAFAPEAQKHVAAIAWLPPSSDFDFQATLAKAEMLYSHDDLFCSVLTAYEVSTKFCDGKAQIMVFNEEEFEAGDQPP